MGNFEAAFCFGVQFAEFFLSVDVELLIDAGAFVAAAYVPVVTEGVFYNLFSLLACGIFY